MTKGVRNVCLALVDPSRSETLILPVPEMEIGEMDEAHPTSNLAGGRSPEHTHLLGHAHVKLGCGRRLAAGDGRPQVHDEL